MGVEKSTMMSNEQKEDAAIKICIHTKVMARCLVHNYVVYDNYGDIEEAYKYANSLYTSKDALVSSFASRKDMTDTIKGVVDKHGDACYQCEPDD
jgi:hypothetical protein